MECRWIGLEHSNTSAQAGFCQTATLEWQKSVTVAITPSNVVCITGKPWLTDGLYPHLWISHYPTVCAGHGKCTRHQDSKSWTCECEIGFTGTFCDSSN